VLDDISLDLDNFNQIFQFIYILLDAPVRLIFFKKIIDYHITNNITINNDILNIFIIKYDDNEGMLYLVNNNILQTNLHDLSYNYIAKSLYLKLFLSIISTNDIIK
jgi:hypothetical protein